MLIYGLLLKLVSVKQLSSNRFDRWKIKTHTHIDDDDDGDLVNSLRLFFLSSLIAVRCDGDKKYQTTTTHMSLSKQNSILVSPACAL
jgi:hypothetical protein